MRCPRLMMGKKSSSVASGPHGKRPHGKRPHGKRPHGKRLHGKKAEARKKKRQRRAGKMEGVSEWERLTDDPNELRLHTTLHNGQSFNWKTCSDGHTFVGTVAGEVFALREDEHGVSFRKLHASKCKLHAKEKEKNSKGTLKNYFQLDAPLEPLYKEWTRKPGRMRIIADALPGMRVLRQDPVECLFSFLLSSNNNVVRITQLLDHMRESFGEMLLDEEELQSVHQQFGEHIFSVMELSRMRGCERAVFHSFPTLEVLAACTEEELRRMKLGYRAPWIPLAARHILQKGGRPWLFGLRQQPYEKVHEELLAFKGIGKKVADCIALFSLDQTACIPVDTHVWQIAVRDYDKDNYLQDTKSLTPTVYGKVGDRFRARFGSHAGWASQLLFSAELDPFRQRLPEKMQQDMKEWATLMKEKRAEKKRLLKAARENKD